MRTATHSNEQSRRVNNGAAPNSGRARYAIEHNIPMPAARNHSVKYPFRDMKVGDSFPFLTQNEYRSIHARAKQVGIKVAIRQTADGYRCWRIK